MLQLVSDGITYLTAQSGESLFRLFWFVVIFELPRYTLGFLSVAAISLYWRRAPTEGRDLHRVTALIAGHNEEDSIERCVRSLHEQTRPPDEIIVVSDGSTDRMAERMRSLQNRGLIKEAHCTQVRAGKSAAVNLALSRATGDVVVVVDCDCTFDRRAIQKIVEPLADPRTAGVSGNVIVRNSSTNLLTAFQAIEYLISISQGRQAADLTGQVSCISGAFGAFRRSALLGGRRSRRRRWRGPRCHAELAKSGLEGGLCRRCTLLHGRSHNPWRLSAPALPLGTRFSASSLPQASRHD